eukprot:1176047-Prorocentrum_minimum.AAC.12
METMAAPFVSEPGSESPASLKRSLDDTGVDEMDQRQIDKAKRQASNAIEVTFRLLCPVPRSGSVIGKGGEIIKQLRADTGARIRIEECLPNAEERVITISAGDTADASWSPAQEALFRVHSRIVEGDTEGELPTGNTSARLLVYGAQVNDPAIVQKRTSVLNVMT